MYVLGLHLKHDSSACLLKDNKLIAFVEEERFKRAKHWFGFPEESINYCLSKAGISLDEVDFVAVGNLGPERSFLQFLYHFYGRGMFMHERLKSNLGYIKYNIYSSLIDRHGTRHFREKGFSPEQFYFAEHHLSHAASTFRCSPFKESLILTMDGWGDCYTSLLGAGSKNSIEVFERVKALNSLGLLYASFTEYLGYPYGKGHEAKVMGMAAFGQPKADFNSILETGKGWYRVNPKYAYGKNTLKNLIRRFGPKHNDPRVLSKKHVKIAATLQHKLEESAINLIKGLLEKADSKNLALAGGVALNCKMNGEIFKTGLVDNIFIQPAAGDQGKALGAALECLAAQGKKARIKFDHAYYGPGYSNEEIKEMLRKFNLKYDYYKDISGHAAEEIAKGKIVAWFQGRMEVGPRALGNRSILADPTKKEIKDKINNRVKGREYWRPLCPSILRSAMEEYFGKDVDAPFMILAFYALEEKRKEIQGVVHVDGTVRPQSVTKKQNKKYWQLIKAFEDLSGTPMVLNTSFNYREPIIRSPEEALRTFYSTGLDGLAIGNYYLEK